MSKHRGFTLAEFMITLAIAAIFIALAIPGYYSLIQNNKAVSAVNKLSASLNYARMEAIKRGVRISVCAAANSSLTSCGNANQWSQGWIVFIDTDNDNVVDGNSDLVKVNEALPTGATITTAAGIVSYDSSGFVSSGATTMTVRAAGCTGNNARQLAIAASGRVSISNVACN
ncbi:GspH/FimT family pseudopilin [Legionella dresdenensis]|uniref:Type II secretion system protein H n=1 Tax=Legionella dresdenensis TaxID=450200 RepID=A0ABV8CHS1_9GAMM